jgi:hypothetical protein
VWLVSNSYLTFGPDGADYTDYSPVGPVTTPVPAIYVGTTDLSNQKYYYGYADGTDVFVIGYEGSIDTGGQENYPAIVWELQVSSATPDQIKIVLNGPNGGQSLNFPGGIWGISDGAVWIDQYQPLPWYSNNNDTTYNAITIAPVTPMTASTIAFTGPGVTYSENNDVTYININPFDNLIDVGSGGEGSTTISSVYYGLTLTTARDGEDLNLYPLGEVNINGGSRSDNQPGDGYQVFINGGNAHDNPNSTGQNFDGGYVNISGGSAVNSGVPGAVRISSNNNSWTFTGDGSISLPSLNNTGYEYNYSLNGPTLHLSDSATNQVIVTGPTPNEGNPSSQRMVIQGQRGYGNWGQGTAGEGGDVYIWGGVGGEADGGGGGSGGDIKVRGGQGQNREGGYVRIEGGDAALWDPGTFGSGGFIDIRAGDVVQGSGDPSNRGGNVTITGGRARTDVANSGSIQLVTGSTTGSGGNQNTWNFDQYGALNVPNNGVIRHNEQGPVNVVSAIYAQLQWSPSETVASPNPNNANGRTNWLWVESDGTTIQTVDVNGVEKTWGFGNDGNLSLPEAAKTIKGWGVTYGLWPNEYDDVWIQSVKYHDGYVYAVVGYYFYNDATSVAKFRTDGTLIWIFQLRSGTGASFNIATNNDGLYALAINQAGAGYKIGQKIYYSGYSLQGTQPANQLTITVTDIDGSGGVIAFSQAGNANPDVTFSYDNQQDPSDSVDGLGYTIDINGNGDLVVTGSLYTQQGSSADSNWTNLNVYTIDRSNGYVLSTTSLIANGDLYGTGISYNSAGNIALTGYNYTEFNEFDPFVMSRTGDGWFEFNKTQFAGNVNYPGDGVIYYNNWLYVGTGISDQSYPSDENNAYLGTTGTVRQGSGATFDITADGAGGYTLLLGSSPGTNYLAGHKIKVLGTSLGGATPANDAVITVTAATAGAIVNASISGTSTGSSTYAGVSGTNFETGSDATFSVYWGYGTSPLVTPNVSRNNGGANYVVGDVITILGSTFAGGVDGQDLILEVTGVGGSAVDTINITSSNTPDWNYQRINITGVDFTVSGGSWFAKLGLGAQSFIYTEGFSKTFGGTGTYGDYAYDLTWDNSGETIYTVGYGRFDNVNYDQGYVCKWSNTGELLWSKVLNYDAADMDNVSIATFQNTDYGTDVIVTGYVYDVSIGAGINHVTRLDEDGTIVWQTKVFNVDEHWVGESASVLTVDENIYIVWENYNGDQNAIYVVKLLGDGSKDWARSIENYNNNNYMYYQDTTRPITTDGTSLYIACYTYVPSDSYSNGLLFKLPIDGSLTGSFGTYSVVDRTNQISTTYVSSPTSTTVTPQVATFTLTTEIDNRNYSIGGLDLALQAFNETWGEIGLVFGDQTVQGSSAGVSPQRKLTRYSAYTISLKDAGAHIYCGPDEVYTNIIIPAELNVQLPIGFKFSIINRSGQGITVFCDYDGDGSGMIYGDGGAGSGSQWIIQDSGSSTIANLIKVESTVISDNQNHKDVWIISTSNGSNVFPD